MTTRHTITHADEIYRGNAYYDYYSPDGRRGVESSHLVLYHFETTAGAAPAAEDNDGIVSSTVATAGFTGDWLGTQGYATGALVTTVGAGSLSLDLARNLVARCSQPSASTPVTIKGTDMYGATMVEVISFGTGGAYVSGIKAFKTITAITTSDIPPTTVSIGTAQRFGLPFHIDHKGRIVAATVDGFAATALTIATGITATGTAPTASHGALDVRGTIDFTADACDGSKRFALLMEVDATEKAKAFGQGQATAGTVTTPT